MDEDANVHIAESDDFCSVHCETCEGGYDPGADDNNKRSNEDVAESSSDKIDDAQQLKEKIVVWKDDHRNNITVNLAGGLPTNGVRELLVILGGIKCNQVMLKNGK